MLNNGLLVLVTAAQVIIGLYRLAQQAFGLVSDRVYCLMNTNKIPG